MVNWDSVKHFGKEENWGNPDLMNSWLVTVLDNYRTEVNSPIIITCGTQGNHVKNSYHYGGLAVDVVIPGREHDLLELFVLALAFPFRGIGIYPNWRYHGKKVGGFHFDMRSLMDGQRKAMWIGISNKDEQTYYMGITQLRLITHLIKTGG